MLSGSEANKARAARKKAEYWAMTPRARKRLLARNLASKKKAAREKKRARPSINL